MSRVRYYLEIVALPAFVFLVVHLSGHGVALLQDSDHEHSLATSSDKGMMVLLDEILTLETLVGIFIMLFFVWIWHRPMFKKWVPCAHEHCHTEKIHLHLFAIGAFCLHFFPEAGIRLELLHGWEKGSVVGGVALVAFLSHFVVDIIVMIILATHWEKKKNIVMTMFFIVSVWFFALWLSPKILLVLPPQTESIMYLISAFLLAMFIHKPHKPVICNCH